MYLLRINTNRQRLSHRAQFWNQDLRIESVDRKLHIPLNDQNGALNPGDFRSQDPLKFRRVILLRIVHQKTAVRWRISLASLWNARVEHASHQHARRFFWNDGANLGASGNFERQIAPSTASEHDNAFGID